jgi:hypothetical protein
MNEAKLATEGRTLGRGPRGLASASTSLGGEEGSV